MKLTASALVSLAFFACGLHAITIHVPEDYPTIGEAINAASDGDSIIVGPGIYDPAPTVYYEPDNITLLGNGYMGSNRTAILGNFTGELEAKIDLRFVDGWEVAGFEMVAGHKGINTSGVTNCHFHDLYVHDVTWYYAVGVELGGTDNVTVERCVFERCTYSGVEIFYNGSTNLTLRNNTIVWTTGAFMAPGNGILVRGAVPGVVLENNILAFNDDDGVEFTPGVYIGNELLDFNDLFGNSGTNWVGCTPGSNNIYADPLFFGGSGAEQYMLLPNSPCIDAGDPNSPLDPDGTIADIGCFYFDQSFTPGELTLYLDPVNPPIILPPQGGSFDYTAAVASDSNYAIFDFWTELLLPDGQIMGPLYIRPSIFLAAGDSLSRQLQMHVSAWAMPGTYEFRGYVGECPNQIWASDLFTFEKLPMEGPLPEGQTACAIINGWDLTEKIYIPVAGQTAGQTLKITGSPNPFNPVTSLTFSLPTSGKAQLIIYDVGGRTLQTLLDRELPAGEHSLSFDGSLLPSGIYIGVLEWNGKRTVERLVLMK